MDKQVLRKVVNIKNNNGQTPLKCAVDRKQNCEITKSKWRKRSKLHCYVETKK